MTITVSDLMRETRNFFPAAWLDAAWTLHSGVLSPDGGLRPGDWIALTGSLHSDGVYQLDQHGRLPTAHDESWQGRVWLLRPTADFLALSEQIAVWAAAQGNASAVKESFGAYSRELATGSTGRPITWQEHFARQLLPFRRMYTEVAL